MVKTKKEKKVQLGKIDPELHKKIVRYAELTGKTKIGVAEDILSDFFKDTLLTNNYLELKKPFYISEIELGSRNSKMLEDIYMQGYISREEFGRLNNTSTFKASLKLPEIDEYIRYAIIKKVPNNLDSFNEDFNKFCYGNNSNRHKGVYLHHTVKISKHFKNIHVHNDLYVMDYVENEELSITPISKHQLGLIIDLKTHKDVYDDIVDETYNFKEWLLNTHGSVDEDILFNENISSEMAEKINVGLYLSCFDVMENLKRYKKKENDKYLI